MIRSITNQDLDAITCLALKIYQKSTYEEIIKEFTAAINNPNNLIVVSIIDNTIIGFAHCSLRFDYVEGTASSPVGYLEGIYVLEAYRNMHHAKKMIEACEKWAKQKGCNEFASDCELNNTNSELFHKALNFKETNRIICFAKKI